MHSFGYPASPIVPCVFVQGFTDLVESEQAQDEGQQQKRRHGSIENEFSFCDVIQPEKQACTAPYANVGLETARPQTANSGVLVPLQRQYLLQQQQLEEQKEEEEERVEPRPRL